MQHTLSGWASVVLVDREQADRGQAMFTNCHCISNVLDVASLAADSFQGWAWFIQKFILSKLILLKGILGPAGSNDK